MLGKKLFPTAFYMPISSVLFDPLGAPWLRDPLPLRPTGRLGGSSCRRRTGGGSARGRSRVRAYLGWPLHCGPRMAERVEPNRTVFGINHSCQQIQCVDSKKCARKSRESMEPYGSRWSVLLTLNRTESHVFPKSCHLNTFVGKTYDSSGLT